MKITAARTTVVGTPWRELVFLELETDTGLVGTSEVRMVSRTDTLLACVDELAPRHVIGTDPFDVERLAWNIQRAEYDRPGEVSQSALACFDVACWDLMGQSLGVPVWKLLGGKFRDRVPAYANGWYQTDRNPQNVATAAKHVVARGYRAMKLDPFGHASAELSAAERRRAVEIVAAVRDAIGADIQIMIEMHGRFTPAQAAAMAQAARAVRSGVDRGADAAGERARLPAGPQRHALADRDRRARPLDGGHPRLHRAAASSTSSRST